MLKPVRHTTLQIQRIEHAELSQEICLLHYIVSPPTDDFHKPIANANLGLPDISDIQTPHTPDDALLLETTANAQG